MRNFGVIWLRRVNNASNLSADTIQQIISGDLPEGGSEITVAARGDSRLLQELWKEHGGRDTEAKHVEIT